MPLPSHLGTPPGAWVLISPDQPINESDVMPVMECLVIPELLVKSLVVKSCCYKAKHNAQARDAIDAFNIYAASKCDVKCTPVHNCCGL